MRRRRLAGGVLVAGLVPAAGVVALPGAPAGAVAATFAAPADPADLPDPSILLAGGTYWAYATGSGGTNLQVVSSPDLQHWGTPRDPLPTLPSWAAPGHTWAPGVIAVDGVYRMYYTVRHAALGIQCVSVATSATPAGPFGDTSTGPLVCQSQHGGSIDPNPYLDASGQLVLIWKSDDNAIGRPTHLWGQPLSADGSALAPGTSPSLLLSESVPWQSPTVEGPTVVRHGSTYVLLYGANRWDSASSGIGYATSPTLLGRYTNRSRSGPWLATTGAAQGPQGPAVFTDAGGATRMAFAAWDGPVGYGAGGARSLWIGTLGFHDGAPQLS